MKRVFSYFLLLAAIVATTAGGILHGTLSQRWGVRQDSAPVAQRLTDFPESFGNWQSRESIPIVQAVRDTLQCTGYLNRNYVHSETGETVSVAVLVGPTGPISVHTPEVCYSSRDFQQRGNRRTVAIRDNQSNQSEFWSVTFDSVGLEKNILKVYYAWSDDGQWAATESPRTLYAGRPYLFKIQLATTLPPGADLKQSDACERFLSEFVPAMNQHVFATELATKTAQTNR